MIKTFSKPTKVVKEATKQRLNEDAASRIADMYDDDVDRMEDTIERFMSRVGKSEQWESPYYTNMNVDESLRELLSEDEMEELLDMSMSATGLGGRTGGGARSATNEAVLENVISILAEEYNEVLTFEEAGLLTRNKGFVIKLGSKTFQFSLLGS